MFTFTVHFALIELLSQLLKIMIFYDDNLNNSFVVGKKFKFHNFCCFVSLVNLQF